MKRIFVSLLIALLALSLLATTAFAAPATTQVARQCPAPGTGMAGAFNMLHDATMWTIAMTRDADKGNDGMFLAVANSSC